MRSPRVRASLTAPHPPHSALAAQPWASFRIEEPRVPPVSEQASILFYRVSARREGSEPYVALVSSTYALDEGEWRLVLISGRRAAECSQCDPGRCGRDDHDLGRRVRDRDCTGASTPWSASPSPSSSSEAGSAETRVWRRRGVFRAGRACRGARRRRPNVCQQPWYTLSTRTPHAARISRQH
jgi:hypothetical protein